MYVPAHFATADADALIQRLARRWAGVLVSVDADATPIATHLPVLWNAETRTISGHIARANPHWKLGEGRGLLVLNGPEAYVSPSYYPSKAEHGKTVPTWNYEAVHLSGRVEWFDDAARLLQVVSDLSDFHERARAEPWAVGDAPRAYIDALMRGIVGVTLHVDRIEAKRKLSQNKSAADFIGVAEGLAVSADTLEREVGELMHAERALNDEPDGN
ncbi:FMN-binding negative transcriptional regulator [Vitreimonas flagellata]|uniref:FMN-binding negative transcriptional regulator n=1 Tax=Vitreimonas flagellata TaxID=2560861 RepID=UPI0010755757|nr:FMN-binding negative transcriptional regulator [Vitreimonas flagellata]